MNEPIGWIYEDDEGRMMFSQMPHNLPFWEPVYRARRKWVGLTDMEISEVLGGDICDENSGLLTFCRAIEAALKAKNA
jgi:hypothetical protein